MNTLQDLTSWYHLTQHHKDIAPLTLESLFKSDPNRAQDFSLELKGLYADYSKTHLTRDTLNYLYGLCSEIDLTSRINALFTGQIVNQTEHRPALHIALRHRANSPIYVDGQDVMPQVNEVLNRMFQFTHQLESGELLGATGKRFTSIVNIGIGGSHLGPQMAYQALSSFHKPHLKTFFVSNLDPDNLDAVLAQCDPQTTLFIIASKSFTTHETMANANAARKYIVDNFGEGAVANHFVAVSTNLEATSSFGIQKERVFPFWDWVGGRYSLASSIGLSLLLSIGVNHFMSLLEGFEAMDQHFLQTPYKDNLPIILGLISLWYINFFKASTHAIIPYSYHLRRLPAYLQQLEMESNGKSSTFSGQTVSYETSPIIWGEPGTDAQHSFFQLLHQGTHLVPIDFIGFAKSHSQASVQHQELLANMFAQAKALAFGQSNSLESWRHFPGNRPSITLLFDELTPFNLGQLIALYEHQVFVMGQIWQINSFDQFGVELGKHLASTISNDLVNQADSKHDSSTASLIHQYRLMSNA